MIRKTAKRKRMAPLIPRATRRGSSMQRRGMTDHHRRERLRCSRAAGSTLAASAAFISSASTAFVCSVSVVIAQFAVRHCELGTGGSRGSAVDWSGRIHRPTKFCARFTLAGLKPLSLRRPSPLASRRQSMYNRTAPSTASTTTKPLWRRTWRPTLLSIFL
jgi:hypothetical protein